jgi:hypothetical protein
MEGEPSGIRLLKFASRTRPTRREAASDASPDLLPFIEKTTRLYALRPDKLRFLESLMDKYLAQFDDDQDSAS